MRMEYTMGDKEQRKGLQALFLTGPSLEIRRRMEKKKRKKRKKDDREKEEKKERIHICGGTTADRLSCSISYWVGNRRSHNQCMWAG